VGALSIDGHLSVPVPDHNSRMEGCSKLKIGRKLVFSERKAYELLTCYTDVIRRPASLTWAVTKLKALGGGIVAAPLQNSLLIFC